MATSTPARTARRNGMHKTMNPTVEENREKVVAILNARLADCVDLYTQTKQAHWNVAGPHFIGLHELFDKIAEAVEEHADLIAERAQQLGGTAYGTARMAAAASTLEEYPSGITTCEDHVAELSARLAAFSKTVNKAIQDTDEMEDPGTSDMFTDIQRDIDKWLWFVESHSRTDR